MNTTMDGKGKERTGHWTKEEMEYLYALVDNFRQGSLDIEDGTTLRAYLAKQLNCGVKRISKKMESSGYNGRQSFERMPFRKDELKARAAKLQGLKKSFERSILLHEQLKNGRFNETQGVAGEAQHRAGAGDNPASILNSASLVPCPPQATATETTLARIGLMSLQNDLLVARMAGIRSPASYAGLPGNDGQLSLYMASPGLNVLPMGGNIGGRYNTNTERLPALLAGVYPAYQPPPPPSLVNAAGLKRAQIMLALLGTSSQYQIEPTAKRSRMN
jgi:hypothetical protein